MKKRYTTLCMMMAVILTVCKAEPKYVTETVMNKFVVSYPGNWNVSDKEGNIRIYSGHLTPEDIYFNCYDSGFKFEELLEACFCCIKN